MNKMPSPRSPEPPSLALLPRAALRNVYDLARSGRRAHRLEQGLRELRCTPLAWSLLSTRCCVALELT